MDRDPKRNAVLRSVAAVLGSPLIFIVAISAVLEVVFHEPPLVGPFLAWALEFLLGTAALIVVGYVAATVARRAELAHALGAWSVAFLFSIALTRIEHLEIGWSSVATPALWVLPILLGACLRILVLRRNARRQERLAGAT